MSGRRETVTDWAQEAWPQCSPKPGILQEGLFDARASELVLDLAAITPGGALIAVASRSIPRLTSLKTRSFLEGSVTMAEQDDATRIEILADIRRRYASGD
ncbi:MAG: hypothetical protein EBS42_06050 [Caulobacteraceae bacterium]|nr:hypothetical protein [Caulobacteraceae bacterium]